MSCIFFIEFWSVAFFNGLTMFCCHFMQAPSWWRALADALYKVQTGGNFTLKPGETSQETIGGFGPPDLI